MIFYTDSGSFGDISVTGSLTIVSGSITLSGPNSGLTGSVMGTASWATNAISSSFATTASAATSITFVPVTASFAISASYSPGGSGTVTSVDIGDGLTGSADPIITSGQISLNTSSVHFTEGVKAKLNADGVISSSTQFTSLTAPFTGSYTGSLVGSLTGTASWVSNVEYANVANKPALISSSTQFTSLTAPFTGSFTGSLVGSLIGTSSWASNVEYANVANKPALISSSAQFTSLTAPFTGSYTGSLVGSLIGTSSWASNAVTASAATSITFVPTSASYATTASFALNGGGGNSFGTFTVSGQSDVVADAAADTVTLVAGTNINITTNAGTDTITINSTGGAAFPFTGSAAVSGSLDVVGVENTQVRILGQSTGSVPLAGTLLQVVASSSIPTRISVDTHNNDSNFGSSIRARRSRGTITAPTAIQSGDVLMQIVGDGYDGTTYQTNQANLAFMADGLWSGTNRGTMLSIRTTPSGSTVSTASVNIRSNRVDLTGSLGVTKGLFVGVSQPIRTPNESVGIYPSASDSYNLVVASASVNSYLQFNLINASNGNSASADFVATNNLGQSSEDGFYVDMGINSSGHDPLSPNSVGRANDSYLYTITSGSLLIGNAGSASGSNVSIFAGKGLVNNSLTSSIFISSSGVIGINTSTPRANVEISGSLLLQATTQVVSGTIAVTGGATASLNLEAANYFAVSASGTGTVLWRITGIVTSSATTQYAQAFMVEYMNGGVVTNSWPTNTKWPGASAPTLTTGTAVDILGFVTDDSGSIWHATLLQRASS